VQDDSGDQIPAADEVTRADGDVPVEIRMLKLAEEVGD
jgi:hypothetical protein